MSADADLAARSVEEARRSRQEVGRTPLFVGAVAAQGPDLLDAAHRSELGPGEHAEFTLLERKLRTTVLAGATVFTTLEPCTKRGPGKVPCAERLIERRVGRVVIGTLDPNPDIRGLGVLALRQARIFHRNFDRRPSDICLHLIEVIGGLSLLASEKSKPGVDKEAQVPPVGRAPVAPAR